MRELLMKLAGRLLRTRLRVYDHMAHAEKEVIRGQSESVDWVFVEAQFTMAIEQMTIMRDLARNAAAVDKGQ